MTLSRAFLLCMFIMVTGCQTSAPPAPPAKMSFTRYQPIHIDVATIDMVEEFNSPMRAPNVEHLMSISPTDAMHSWVKDRLRAVGGSKSLQVIIKDASVTATELPKKGGLNGFFTDQQDKEYNAHLAVEMRIYGTRALSEASLKVEANRSITIPQSASAATRDAILRRLLQDLMENINAELEKNIFTYFGNYINYSQMP